MAVVGEAHILVRALTTGFADDLRQQLKGINGSVVNDGRRSGESLGSAFNRGFNRSAGNIFGKVSEGLKSMVPEAEGARLQFRSLVRVTYTLGTALTVLVGGIASLVGGLVTLIAALGRALPAVAGIATAFIQMRLAISFAQFALKGIGAAVSAATQQNRGLKKSIAEINEEFQQLQFRAEEAALSENRAALNLEAALENLRRTADLPPNSAARRDAQLSYEEAELAYRRAKDRTKDLNEELAKGPEALADSAGNDPYEGLTESQKKFAQFLVGLRPKLDVLREAVASGFLPLLQTQIQDLVDFYFPDLEDAFKRIGVALGVGSGNMFDNFLEESTKAEVNLFFDNLEKNIPLIGEIFGELGEVLLKVFNDADGIGTKFLEFIRDTLVGWNEELDKFGLADTFDNAFNVGSRLFGIIGDTVNGLGDFFRLLDGEGGAIDILLTYLEGAAEGFAALGDEGNPAGKELSETYKGLAANFGPIMTFIGLLVDSLLKLGANPAIGEFFDKLNTPANAANWDAIFEAFANAGPALGNLIVTLGELFAAFADEGSPTVFFETLSALIKPIAAFFGSDEVKPFIDDIARMFAFITAATFVFEQIKFVLFAIIGNVILFFHILSKVPGAFTTIKTVVGGLGKAIGGVFGFLGNTLKIIVGGFTQAVIAVARTLVVIIKDIVIGILTVLRSIVSGALSLFARIGAVFVNGFIYVRAFLGAFFPWVLGAATALFRGIGVLFRFLGGPWGILIGLLITGLTFFFTKTETGKKVWGGFVNFVSGLLKNLGDFFGTIFDNITQGWENMVNFFKSLNPLDAIKKVGEGIGDWFSGLFGQNRSGISIPGLAEGGTVMPRAGGTIVRVAEAGRPERVEPLDDRGLSRRDYAMMTALSGSRGGGINITVNPSPGMDERELASIVSRRISHEIRKGAI
jgi:hypothetical protein